MSKQKLTERRVETVQLVEDQSTPNRVKFTAVVSEGDYINQNGRLYPFDILWAAFQETNKSLARYPGAVDHPDPWVGLKTADLGIRWEGFEPEPGGKRIIGTGHTLGTDSGKNLAAIIEDGIEIGFSTRTSAAGEEKTIDGRTVFVITEMDPPFVDAVTNPSVAFARVQNYSKEEVDMEKELEAALEAKHKAETALAVANAVAEHKDTVLSLTTRAETAESALKVANDRIAALEAEKVEAAKANEATALEAKLTVLTKDDQFGPAIVAKAKAYAGLTESNVEQIVALCRDSLQAGLSAANQGGDAKPRGDVTTDEDRTPETVDESKLSDEQKLANAAFRTHKN